MLKSVGSQKLVYKLTTKQPYCGRSEDTKINNNWSLTLRNFSLLIPGLVDFSRNKFFLVGSHAIP